MVCPNSHTTAAQATLILILQPKQLVLGRGKLLVRLRNSLTHAWLTEAGRVDLTVAFDNPDRARALPIISNHRPGPLACVSGEAIMQNGYSATFPKKKLKLIPSCTFILETNWRREILMDKES